MDQKKSDKQSISRTNPHVTTWHDVTIIKHYKNTQRPHTNKQKIENKIAIQKVNIILMTGDHLVIRSSNKIIKSNRKKTGIIQWQIIEPIDGPSWVEHGKLHLR